MNCEWKTLVLTTVWFAFGLGVAVTQSGCNGSSSPSAESPDASRAPSTSNSMAASESSTTPEGNVLRSEVRPLNNDSAIVPREERAVSRSRTPIGLPNALGIDNTWLPQVLLSDKYAATCLKNVGDSFAEANFSKVDVKATLNDPQTLKSMLGSKLTVVVFCDLEFDSSAEQVRRLEQEVSRSYRELGVASVAIHVGDGAAATDFVSQIPNDTLLLVDTENEYENLATMRPPRTFLLNANGEIVWLDIEYSRGMRIELDNAIRFHLKQLFDTTRSVADRNWH